jgi:hypothetical protein
MPRMKALKTFRVGDTQKIVHPGHEFETKNTRHYETRGLAVAVGDVVKPASPQEAKQNQAAETGPLASPGGETGEDKRLSSSRLGRRQKTRTSKPSGDEPASSQ